MSGPLRITRQTDDQLILDAATWLTGILLILFILGFVGAGLVITFDGGEPLGLLFAAAGGGMGFLAFALFVERLQAVFDRTTGTARLIRRTTFTNTATTLPLDGIDRAIAEENRSRDTRRSTWRLALRMTDGTIHALTPVYTSGNGTARSVAVINAWLGVAED